MAKHVSRFKRTMVIGSAVVLTLGGAGVAFAYWSATGEGVGEAQTDDAIATFLVETEAADGTIAPGNPGQTIAFTVTNESDGDMNLTSVTVTMAEADGTPWAPATGCLIADYTAAITEQATFGNIAPAGSVGGEITVTLANTGVDQNACKGEDVPLLIKAS